MITEAQQRLAHFIAKAGIWKYPAIIALMEKRSPEVEQFKIVAQRVTEEVVVVDTTSLDYFLNRAYFFARTTDEEGIAKFGTAYVAFIRQLLPVYKEKVDRFKKELLERGKWYASREDKERIKPTWEAMYSEKDAYLQARAALCMEGDPFSREASK